MGDNGNLGESSPARFFYCGLALGLHSLPWPADRQLYNSVSGRWAACCKLSALGPERKRGGLEAEEKCCCPRGPGRDLWSSVAAVSGTAGRAVGGAWVSDEVSSTTLS